MAAVKVFNYICGLGGFAEFSQLLKQPSPLAKKTDVPSVVFWFEKEKALGSFDSAHSLVLTKNRFGKSFGIRIDLKKQICLKYCTPNSCRMASGCKFWHVCKEFLEGTCKGNCERSHDFHNDDNKSKIAELGFEKKSSANLRSIVAGSLPQVCLSYLQGECGTVNCPYLHICRSQVQATPCECSLSHAFTDPHNKIILEQFGFNPPRTSQIDVVRCNILVPKQQKPIEDNKRLAELSKEHERAERLRQLRENSRRQTAPRDGRGGNTGVFGSIPASSEHERVEWLRQLHENSCRETAPRDGRGGNTGVFGSIQASSEHERAEWLRQLRENSRRQTAPRDGRGGNTGVFGSIQASSKVKGTKPVTLAGLIQEASISREPAVVPPPQQGPISAEADPLLEKVFNYICGKGGIVTLSDLLQHPSPLAKKFPAPGKECDAKIWLQVQAQSDQSPRLSLLENEDGDVLGAQVKLKKKMCLNYASNGACGKPSCQFWHVCKGYLEGKCGGKCGLSHDFHDEGNMKNVQKLGLEKQPSGTIKKVLANSLPQVCLNYLKNECLSSSCPYLHICCSAAQGNPCSCSSSHELANLDTHNMGILKQFELVPHPNKLNIVYSNILIPKQQRTFEDSSLSSTSEIPSLMSLPLKTEPQSSEESSKKKKKRNRQRPKRRNRQNNQHSEQMLGETQGTHSNSSDSDSDNEDSEKPDLYASSKFAVDPNKCELRKHVVTQQEGKGKKRSSISEEQHISAMHVTEGVEENLINLSDDDDDNWQSVEPVDNFSTSNYELLSQVDEMFFNDWFGSTNITESLSQESGISLTSEQSTEEQESAVSERSTASLVFECICKEYGGQVPFSVISKREDLFPLDVDIATWFRENGSKFITFENNVGELEAIRAFNPRVRICFRYLLTKNGCKDPKCFRYHVCNHYLATGVCPFGKKCRYSHSHNLRSPHNKRITSQLRLKTYSEDQLRSLISASVPEVCLDYNNHSCQRGFRCNGIHICKNFVMKQCNKGDRCPFGHQLSLQTKAAKLVLGRYNLTKVPAHAVLGALLVRHPLLDVEKTAKPKTGELACF